MNVAAAPRLGSLIAALESRGYLRSVLPPAPGHAAVRPAEVSLAGVTLDSRRVSAGWLFAAVPGQRLDGHEFVPRAVASGAVAVLAERATPGVSVPQLLVHAARPALALAAAWFNAFPSHRLGIVGVTGTDGKTTTCFLVRAILEAAGHSAGALTTIDVVVGGRSLGNAGRATTPEAPETQAHLAAMERAGDRFAVVESTSHGLAQHRVGEVAYDVSVLTNVTQEHLEFHGTPAAYRAAKRRLFESLAAGPSNPEKGWGKTGVVNLDDPCADEFAHAARSVGARVLSYGTDPRADVRAVGVQEDASGLRVTADTPRWKGTVHLRLAGRFNAHNALAGLAVAEALGLDPEHAKRGLESVESVRGRMQRIDGDQPFSVVVDYAHTVDSLTKALDNLAPVAGARGGGLIAVFGSAGERDVVKRPAMGRVAGERCRLVVVTDEDPRGEDREAILEEIAAGAEAAGLRRGHDLLLIADRREAIETAIEHARPGDVVLLAGKGHERTIEMAGGAIEWDEAAAAREALRRLGHRVAVA